MGKTSATEVDEAVRIAGAKPAGKRGKAIRVIVVAAAAIVVAVLAFVGYGVYTGDLAPTDAAAKYDGMHYLPEDEVTDYIQLYQEQMGLAESSGSDWATFLAAYNLTPARLRYSTIQQIVSDKLVQAKADELGIAASEEEIDASITTLRNTLGLGDSEILRQTLQAHGQTEEGLREVYRQAIVKRMVLSSEVEMPEPTDEQVKEFMKTYDASLASTTARHTYCMRLPREEQEGDRTNVTHIAELRAAFAKGDKTPEAFSAMVKAEAVDEDLAARGGANGWDIDSAGYSEEYLEALEPLEVGDVSEVFSDDDGYAFIWVSEDYELPTASEAIDALDPEDVPASLWSYLSDSAAYKLWETAGNAYLDKMLQDADVVYYPMPADVPYNVDMSLADVQLEEVSSGASASAGTASSEKR